MKINEDSKIAFSESTEKYYSFKKAGNTITLSKVSRKPRGGALTALQRIQKLLEFATLEPDEKMELTKIAHGIEDGYLDKNVRKPSKSSFESFKRDVYRKHTEKIRKIADRIVELKPPYPSKLTKDEWEGIITQSIPSIKTLGELSLITKESYKAASQSQKWVVRARLYGWPSKSSNVEEAKTFLKDLIKGLRKLGFHELANAIIHPKPTTFIFSLHGLMHPLFTRTRMCPVSNNSFIALICLLAKTTSVSVGNPKPYVIPNKYIERHFRRLQRTNPQALVAYARLFKNIGHDLLPIYGKRFIKSFDIQTEEAKQILALTKPSSDYKALLSTAVSLDRFGWAEALAHKLNGTKIDVAPKSDDMRKLLTEANVTFPDV